MPDHRTGSPSPARSPTFSVIVSVIETSEGAVLADLTPKGAEQHAARVGEVVGLSGEMKPSELKVSRPDSQARPRSRSIMREEAAPSPSACRTEGRDEGGPGTPASNRWGSHDGSRKHFEALGRRDRRLTELHVELNGHIRKMKPGRRYRIRNGGEALQQSA